MIDLERRYGPATGRVWGLVANLAANAAALYGLVSYLRDGTQLVLMASGLVLTAACLMLLARPDK